MSLTFNFPTFSQQGFLFYSHTETRTALLNIDPQGLDDWAQLSASWQALPQDLYMADGGRYRRRRYRVLYIDHQGNCQPSTENVHYQDEKYNALNGGVARYFELISSEVLSTCSFQVILQWGKQVVQQLIPNKQWRVECHQFRIESSALKIGQPTPEGIHRDGVDFVMVVMVKRQNIQCGETVLYNTHGDYLDSFTLRQPLDTAWVDDHQCLHGVTPIEPIDGSIDSHRDVLVITFKVLPERTS